jgi:hypothetical protein
MTAFRRHALVAKERMDSPLNFTPELQEFAMHVPVDEEARFYVCAKKRLNPKCKRVLILSYIMQTMQGFKTLVTDTLELLNLC